jgi:hypothetical protein
LSLFLVWTSTLFGGSDDILDGHLAGCYLTILGFERVAMSP